MIAFDSNTEVGAVRRPIGDPFRLTALQPVADVTRHFGVASIGK